MKIEDELVRLAQKLIALQGDSSGQAKLERDQAREKIKFIGSTANCFYGQFGMQYLHDECEALTGNSNQIGQVLNVAWDGIGDWYASHSPSQG